MAEQERTPKVLIVDDDPRLRDLLRRYLGDNGFSVSVADGAPAMNRIWMRERFDALILDLMLPGEDGLQILRRLRARKDMTPVLMLTARGHPRVPLSRDKLMEMARGREYEAFDRSLDVQVSRLRKLIEPDPSKPRYLQTVWGLGYVFIPDDPQDANKA